MTQFLWVPGPLPGLNELIAAAKGAKGRGVAYARLKREWTARIAMLAKSERLHPVGPGAYLRFRFLERDRRRDPDNIAAGARKLILDGLVEAGVLSGDGWDGVSGWADMWDIGEFAVGVQVEITGVR